ncbi:MAG: aminotransferase class III-fold pyridoxal phosphate-dependent enzyme [Elusimicrobiota bacterium]|jgi:glutamate-1-semialdehyde 2,1-aminomutase/spore coat polysaccharide biosynthesis protein SpsF
MTRRPKVVAVIQARMGSERLPGKTVAELDGRPVIEHVIERAAAIPGVHEVVLAIPEGPANRPLAEAASRTGKAWVFAGSENDVLDRFCRAGRKARADVLVRITGDCPLLDPAVSGRVVKAVLDGRADYASNVDPPTYPDGLDTEAFPMSVLEASSRIVTVPSEREHVTSGIMNHPERFRRVNVAQDRNLSGMRWVLDQPEDLAFLRALYAAAGKRRGMLTTKQILDILERHPEIAKMNSHIKPNEGYYLSILKDPPKPSKKLKVTRSMALWKEAVRLIPSASQTFSKSPNQFVRGVCPLFLERGKGCRVWDVDGNELLDTTMALGPIILGYGDPDVEKAAISQLKKGTVFSQPHPLEVETARLLTKIVPCAEMVRFAKTGSDATAASVRLARYATGRDVVLAGGYHGWDDWFIGTTTRAGGVPKAVRALTDTFTYNDLGSVEAAFRKHRGKVAAVILEPIGVEEPKDGFLKELARLTRRNGAILIFDEIVTGLRISIGGAQEYYGVTPDLATFGKAMANGYPLSAVVGKAALMRKFDEIFFSGTFGGETVSLAASMATIDKMRSKDVIPHIWHQGRRLSDGFNTMARELGVEKHLRCVGLAPRTVVDILDDKGSDWWELRSLFQQECARRGLLFTGAHDICYAHKDADIDEILRIYAGALRRSAEAMRLKKVSQWVEGPLVEPIFRKA